MIRAKLEHFKFKKDTIASTKFTKFTNEHLQMQ